MKRQKFKKQAAQRFYRQLYTTFPLHNTQEKKFLDFFKKRLKEYEIQYPEATYQDYIYHFGLPEDIITFFYQHHDHHYVISHMKSRKIIKYTACIIIPLVVVCLIYFLYTTYQNYQNYIEFPYYEEEIIYDYGTITMHE